MDIEFPQQRRPASAESGTERRARIQREAALIAKAEADIDAGLGIADPDLERWLDALDHDETRPPPTPRGSVPPTR